jgi:hypothetical protein
MAKGKLFEFSVLYHPKQTKDTAGNDTTPASQLIVDKQSTLAINEKEVGLRASRAIPVEYDNRLDDCEVLVRPF